MTFLTERPIEELRQEAADAARALAAAFDAGDMTNFHFELGKIWAIAGGIYDRNHANDLALSAAEAQRSGGLDAHRADESGYETNNPKHPEFHSTHSDLWDNREKGEA